MNFKINTIFFFISDNYINLSERLNFSEKLSLKYQQDGNDLDQIVLNEEINYEDEEDINDISTKNENFPSNISLKSLRSSIVHYNEKNGKTIHEIKEKINETNYSKFI